MSNYVVISSRLKAFTPGQIVTDEDLIAVGVEPLKSLAIGAIAQEVKTLKHLASMLKLLQKKRSKIQIWQQ